MRNGSIKYTSWTSMYISTNNLSSLTAPPFLLPILSKITKLLGKPRRYHQTQAIQKEKYY